MDDVTKSRIKISLMVFGILLLAGLGLWFGRPAYRNWKQTRFLKQAHAYLAKSDYPNASLCARKILIVNPANVEACRIMARLAETFHSPQLINWRQRILELQPNVLTNHLDLAKAAFVQGNLPLARKALQGVDEKDQKTAAYQELAGLLAAAANQIRAGEEHLAEALRLDPENKRLQLNLAVLQLQSHDQSTANAARESLEKLTTDEQFRLDALRTLMVAAMRTNDLRSALALSDRLIADPKAAFSDCLSHLALLKKSSTNEGAAYLAKLQKEAVDKPQNIASLVGWMIGQDNAEQARQWVTHLPPKVQEEMPVVMATVDIYQAQKDWKALNALLQKKKWDGLEFARLALLARVAAAENHDLSRHANWRSAIREAGERLKPMTMLVKMAAAWRWGDEEEELLWLILQRFPTEHWTLQALERRYLAIGSTMGLNKVYSTMLEYNSKDVLAMNNYAATSLLLNLNEERARELAKAAYEQRPDQAVPASTYAFALHLQGRTKEGIQVLEKLPPKQLETPNIAAYYGVLLAAAGETNQARKYLQIASHAHLLPEEKSLVAQALPAP